MADDHELLAEDARLRQIQICIRSWQNTGATRGAETLVLADIVKILGSDHVWGPVPTNPWMDGQTCARCGLTLSNVEIARERYGGVLPSCG